MSFHDDSSKKETKVKGRKPIPVGKRKVVRDCQVGDVVQFCDGRTAVVTAWLNGGPMGRWHDEEGNEGELSSLGPDDTPIVRLRGIK